MENKMVEALNRTIKTYKTLYNNKSFRAADEVFNQFMAQAKLVSEVTGKVIELEETEDGYTAVLK